MKKLMLLAIILTGSICANAQSSTRGTNHDTKQIDNLSNDATKATTFKKRTPTTSGTGQQNSSKKDHVTNPPSGVNNDRRQERNWRYNKETDY